MVIYLCVLDWPFSRACKIVTLQCEGHHATAVLLVLGVMSQLIPVASRLVQCLAFAETWQQCAPSWEMIPLGPCQGHLLAKYGQKAKLRVF